MRIHKPVPRTLCSPISLAAVFITLALCGCRGGGDSQAGQPSPDFNLSLSQSNLMIPGGASASIFVSVTGSNGFSSPVTVQVTGLAPGVIVTPTDLQVKPGSSQEIIFTSADSVASSSAFVTVVGISGNLIHTAQLSLSIHPQPPAAPLPDAKTPGISP